jgi:SAM-dependent methyltransferase
MWTTDPSPSAGSRSAEEDLARALEVVVPALDIARERVVGPEPPGFSEARGYTGFLGALTDEELARCESEGLAACLPSLAEAPASLVRLAEGAADIARLPGVLEGASGPDLEGTRKVGERKRRQLEVLLGALRPLGERARRIVDVGAGAGHFSRLAADLFDRDVVGIEREAARARVAAMLAEGTRASFLLLDACREPLVLEPGDLAVGLHACGALGDRIVMAAAEAPCDVVLVSCCLQKIEGPARMPLSAKARAAGLVLPREVLGLSNLTARLVGVEASLAEMLDARRSRFALARLLRARGLEIAPGEEMRGQNRRRAHGPFAELAARALALRGLSAPSERELREHEEAARVEFQRMRRFSLPRAMLARALEVTVVLDRAAALEERGHVCRVVRVFDPEVSPRNLAIFASPRPG